jgi:hypothetical protein
MEQAYVLGNHSGEAPPGSLVKGEPGNRIRAVAGLEGGPHNVLYHFEAPDLAGLQTHSSTVTQAGTTVMESYTVCVFKDCVTLNPQPPIQPMGMPPYDIYIFGVVEAEGRLSVLEEIRVELDVDVAAANDGHGHFVIELGAADRSKLEQALSRLTAASNVRNVKTGWATRSSVVRAE